MKRPRISRILQNSPRLAGRIATARRVAASGEVSFQPEHERVTNLIVKLARGHHAVYELNEQRLDAPTHTTFMPIHTLNRDALRCFENPPQLAAWPEIGTRAMQRMVVAAPGNSVLSNDWLEVQEGQYRYVAIAESVVMIRIVIGEYLACEVVWAKDRRYMEALARPVA